MHPRWPMEVREFQIWLRERQCEEPAWLQVSKSLGLYLKSTAFFVTLKVMNSQPVVVQPKWYLGEI